MMRRGSRPCNVGGDYECRHPRHCVIFDPEVAGRWVGSGTRTGQLVFTVRGVGAIRGGAVPLRFVLTTP